MTIATSDSAAGAGIQADLLTFAAHGVFGITALAALTAQNPSAVTAIKELPPEFLQAQLESNFSFFQIGAAKTGMLFSESLIEAVAASLAVHPLPLVVDPVMASTSGACLLQPGAVKVIREKLFPQARLITPNLDEIAILLGSQPKSLAAMHDAARKLSDQFGCAVLVKGGHLPGDAVWDVLVEPSGDVREWSDKRVSRVDTHGSGCTLSAAIAANLARGMLLTDAVDSARCYLLASFRQSLTVAGKCYINHFPQKW